MKAKLMSYCQPWEDFHREMFFRNGIDALKRPYICNP